MDVQSLVNLTGVLCYAAQAVVAVWGTYCVVLLFRRIKQKAFRSQETEALFFSKLREHLRGRDYEGVLKVCNAPAYWEKAVPRLAAVAIENREQGLPRIRQLLVECFEREVLADFQNRLLWVQMVVKSAPMLGLWGTVLGLIGAFMQVASSEGYVSASELAGNIGLALYTTAIGLFIAIPLLICLSFLTIRIRKLEDAVEQGVTRFLEEFAQATAGAAPQPAVAGYAQSRG